jgi:cell division septation protein DedD
VADLTHESPDDAFHEIQLSGKQLVFLFMATTVVSVVIFLCGVLVGRGVRAQDIGMDPAIAAAADPQPATQEPPAAVPADPPVTPSEPPLSYHQRLESEKSPAEDLKARSEPRPAPPDTARAAAPPVVPKPAASSGPYTPQPGTWAVQVQALRDRDAATQVVQRLRGKGYPAFLVAPTLGAPTQLFRIQVGRYSDRTEAQQVEARLKKDEQFDTFIVR